MSDNRLKLESCPKCNGVAFTRGDGVYCSPAQAAPPPLPLNLQQWLLEHTQRHYHRIFENVTEFDYVSVDDLRNLFASLQSAKPAPDAAQGVDDEEFSQLSKGWVKVSPDSWLPSFGQNVLLCINGLVQPHVYSLDEIETATGGSKRFWLRRDESDDDSDHPLIEDGQYWMLLPSAPAEPYTSPQPVQGVAESVADEETIKEIAVQIVRDVCETDPADPEHPETLAIKCGALQSIIEQALEERFKQSRQSPRAAEGMESVRQIIANSDFDAMLALRSRAQQSEEAFGEFISQSALSHSSKGDEHGK